MRKIFIFVSLLTILLAGCVVYLPPPERGPSLAGEVYPEYDLDYIYDYLSDYGFWVYQPPYGYVWVPEVRLYRWRPYSYGYWVWTDFGWTWISRFNWGWIPFHYGRWGWSRDLGWFWVPGDIWAPAWVVWRYSRYYVGWAPLPPSIRFDVRVGLISHSLVIPSEYWVFVEVDYFLHSRLYRYLLPVERSLTLVRKTSLRARLEVHNRLVYNRALEKQLIEQATRRTIRKYELAPQSAPGATRVRLNRVEMFRPKIKSSPSARPKKIVNKTKIKNQLREKEIISSGEQKAVKSSLELRRVHEKELKLLEKSHQREVEILQKELEVKKAQVRNPAEKRKIEESYKKKIQEVTREHAQEKNKLKKRQAEEKKKVVRGQVKKKKIKRREAN